MSEPEVHVISPPGHISEKKYIFEVLIEDFLNLSYSFEVNEEENDFLIQKGSRKVIIPDVFFSLIYDQEVPDSPSLQEVPIDLGQLISKNLPAWFLKKNAEVSTVKIDTEQLPADIVGMAFFLLTGYADIHFSEQDEHLRSKGHTSFVVRNNLIDRPIIQEWFTVLAQLLYGKETIIPGKQIPAYSKHVSHDVDQPFEYLFYTKSRLLKRLSGDLLVRKNTRLAKKRLRKYLAVKRGKYSADPYNNFVELISLLNKQGIKSTFFFVSGENESEFDVLYEINHPAVKMILHKIYKSGHKIGLHPSYGTRHNFKKLNDELNRLKNVCKSISPEIDINRTRKHYLRWDWKRTPSLFQKAGIKHDYTVGYADRSGFRVGVAFPYRAFSWEEKKSLAIKLHPLIVMEASLLSGKYMGLSLKEAEGKITHYHEQLKHIGGEFVLLWHNHWLLDEKMELFKTYLRL